MPTPKPASNYPRLWGSPAHSSPALKCDGISDNILTTDLECRRDHKYGASQRGLASQQGAEIGNYGSPSQRTAAAVLLFRGPNFGKSLAAALRPRQAALVPCATFHA